MSMVLTKVESVVYEAIRRLGRAKYEEVRRATGLNSPHDPLKRLRGMGIIERPSKGIYVAKDVRYSIGSRMNQVPPIQINTNVPAELRRRIINQFEQEPRPSRKQVAEALGMSRLVLNQILIEEGLDSK